MWLSSYNFFVKNDGEWYLKNYWNICSFIFFSSFLISFENSSRNFNGNILRLFFAFVAFLGSVATSGFVAGSGVGWRVGTLSKYFVWNNMLLKLSRIFSLALNNNPKLF